jgi:hypothetical protein
LIVCVFAPRWQWIAPWPWFFKHWIFFLYKQCHESWLSFNNKVKEHKMQWFKTYLKSEALILAYFFKFVSKMLNLQLPTYQTWKIKQNTNWALAHNTLGVSQGHVFFAKSMPPLGILTMSVWHYFWSQKNRFHMSRINYQQNCIRGCFSRTRLIWPGPDSRGPPYVLTLRPEDIIMLLLMTLLLKSKNKL